MEQVLPGVAIPVIFTHFELPVCISSTRSALARFSAVKWSREAIGRQPIVLHKKSTSSLSISLTTIIFILSKKWTARSESPSLRIDFWMSRNIAPGLLHLLHNVEDICALLAKHPVRGGVVGHNHLVVHVGLWWRHTELDEANLCFLHPFWTVDVGRLLLKDHPVHQLSIVNSAAKLLDDLNVFQIDIILPGRVDHL